MWVRRALWALTHMCWRERQEKERCGEWRADPTERVANVAQLTYRRLQSDGAAIARRAPSAVTSSGRCCCTPAATHSKSPRTQPCVFASTWKSVHRRRNHRSTHFHAAELASRAAGAAEASLAVAIVAERPHSLAATPGLQRRNLHFSETTFADAPRPYPAPCVRLRPPIQHVCTPVH